MSWEWPSGDRRVDAESGFTLLEVMQTMAFLAIGLLGLSSLTIGTIHGNVGAKQITSATVLAQDKIEELRHADFAAVVEGSDQIVSGGVPYTREWSVCTNCPVAGAKEVSIVVTWYDQEDKAITLQTILGE